MLQEENEDERNVLGSLQKLQTFFKQILGDKR